MPDELKFKPRENSKSHVFTSYNVICIDLDHIEHLNKDADKYKSYINKLKTMHEEKHRIMVNKVLNEYTNIRKNTK